MNKDEKIIELEEALVESKAEVDFLTSQLENREALIADKEKEIKERERAIKRLDPQERIERHAHGEVTPEDRLRDRLEFTEEELKKSQKLNEKFTFKVRDLERLHNVFDQVFSNVDWSARKVTPPMPSGEGKTRAHEFLALMSDAHYGEVVEPSAALGISYNCDIAQRRIEHYRDVIIRYKDLREPAYNIDKLTVAVLGDMLSGEIHEELRVTNEKSVVEQEAEMTNILWDLACDFAEEFPQVEFVVLPGNHPRLYKKPEFKKKWANWEWSMGKGLEKLVEVSPLENVTITVPEAMVYTHKIFDYNIAMTHGDGIKSNSFAGIPFYGMRQRRERLQELLSSRDLERADMFVMGHFHQHLWWGGGDCDILINGAIKGGDEYSIGTFLSAPEPIQVLLEFHPEHGVAAQEHISFAHIN